jgi:acid phosphatase (class A)
LAVANAIFIWYRSESRPGRLFQLHSDAIHGEDREEAHMRVSRSVVILLLMLWAGVLPASAAAPYFLSRDSVNLPQLLAPPPGPQDAPTKADLDELRQIQKTRTPERMATARADRQESLLRFLLVFSKPLTAEQLPKTVALFKRLAADAEFATDPAKKAFARPRPYTLTGDLTPACPHSESGAYPSSHATAGYLMAIVLAEMVPEQRDAIFARAQDYAESRLVCGVHLRSDIEAGRIAGTVLAAVVRNNPKFKAEFAAARAELRAALGY